MGRDPWGGQSDMPSTLHSYNYVAGNPINYVDPTGLRRIEPECSGGSTDLFSYGVTRYSDTSSMLIVNYQQEPWACYKSDHAPNYPVLIPVRHPLNLLEENPNCSSSLEVAKAFYTGGAFTTWEVNARNIVAEIKGVIENQREWALPDAIGLAYIPYNRVDFNTWEGPRYPGGNFMFPSYENRGDALGMLLMGDEEFTVAASPEYAPDAYSGAQNLGTGENISKAYHFALIVAYGVDNKFFRDTSYGATGYYHRKNTECSNEYTFFRNQRVRWYEQANWNPTTAELQASGEALGGSNNAWEKWLDMGERFGNVEWETSYPPSGCTFNP